MEFCCGWGVNFNQEKKEKKKKKRRNYCWFLVFGGVYSGDLVIEKSWFDWTFWLDQGLWLRFSLFIHCVNDDNGLAAFINSTPFLFVTSRHELLLVIDGSFFFFYMYSNFRSNLVWWIVTLNINIFFKGFKPWFILL